MVFLNNDTIWKDFENHERSILERNKNIQHLKFSRINKRKEKDFSTLSQIILCEKYGSHRNHRKKFLEDMGFSADPKNKDDESIYRQFIGNKTDMISISKDKLLIICARIVDN